jgi:hypothetical protein
MIKLYHIYREIAILFCPSFHSFFALYPLILLGFLLVGGGFWGVSNLKREGKGGDECYAFASIRVRSTRPTPSLPSLEGGCRRSDRGEFPARSGRIPI